MNAEMCRCEDHPLAYHPNIILGLPLLESVTGPKATPIGLIQLRLRYNGSRRLQHPLHRVANTQRQIATAVRNWAHKQLQTIRVGNMAKYCGRATEIQSYKPTQVSSPAEAKKSQLHTWAISCTRSGCIRANNCAQPKDKETTLKCTIEIPFLLQQAAWTSLSSYLHVAILFT